MAVYSMTGYATGQSGGPADARTPDHIREAQPSVGVEIRSVNSRFLDLSFKLPDDLRGAPLWQVLDASAVPVLVVDWPLASGARLQAGIYPAFALAQHIGFPVGCMFIQYPVAQPSFVPVQRQVPMFGFPFYRRGAA